MHVEAYRFDRALEVLGRIESARASGVLRQDPPWSLRGGAMVGVARLAAVFLAVRDDSLRSRTLEALRREGRLGCGPLPAALGRAFAAATSTRAVAREFGDSGADDGAEAATRAVERGSPACPRWSHGRRATREPRSFDSPRRGRTSNGPARRGNREPSFGRTDPNGRDAGERSLRRLCGLAARACAAAARRVEALEDAAPGGGGRSGAAGRHARALRRRGPARGVGDPRGAAAGFRSGRRADRDGIWGGRGAPPPQIRGRSRARGELPAPPPNSGRGSPPPPRRRSGGSSSLRSVSTRRGGRRPTAARPRRWSRPLRSSSTPGRAARVRAARRRTSPQSRGAGRGAPRAPAAAPSPGAPVRARRGGEPRRRGRERQRGRRGDGRRARSPARARVPDRTPAGGVRRRRGPGEVRRHAARRLAAQRLAGRGRRRGGGARAGGAARARGGCGRHLPSAGGGSSPSHIRVRPTFPHSAGEGVRSATALPRRAAAARRRGARVLLGDARGGARGGARRRGARRPGTAAAAAAQPPTADPIASAAGARLRFVRAGASLVLACCARAVANAPARSAAALQTGHIRDDVERAASRGATSLPDVALDPVGPAVAGRAGAAPWATNGSLACSLRSSTRSARGTRLDAARRGESRASTLRARMRRAPHRRRRVPLRGRRGRRASALALAAFAADPDVDDATLVDMRTRRWTLRRGRLGAFEASKDLLRAGRCEAPSDPATSGLWLVFLRHATGCDSGPSTFARGGGTFSRSGRDDKFVDRWTRRSATWASGTRRFVSRRARTSCGRRGRTRCSRFRCTTRRARIASRTLW